MEGKRILVVDDRAENLDAARRYFETRTDLEVIYENDPVKAILRSQSGELEGALIDVFMPADKVLSSCAYRTIEQFGPSGPRSEPAFRKSLKAILEDLDREAPVGIIAIDEAHRKKLPYVIVTSMSHHAKKFEAVFQYFFVRYGGYPDLDGRLQEGWQGEQVTSGATLDFLKDKPNRNKDRPEFWAEAYKKLEKQIK